MHVSGKSSRDVKLAEGMIVNQPLNPSNNPSTVHFETRFLQDSSDKPDLYTQSTAILKHVRTSNQEKHFKDTGSAEESFCSV